MSHEIQKAVFSQREGAGWTGLGQPIPDAIKKDPRKIAELCGALYSVRKVPLTYVGTDGKQYIAENRVALIRDDDNNLLEVVSENRYHLDLRQPVDIFETFRDELAKESMEISHGAVLRGGAIIAVCARFADGDFQVGPDAGLNTDRTETYLTGSTGYDKQHGSKWFQTGERTVCANTLAIGIAGALRAGKMVSVSASTKLQADSLRKMLAAAKAGSLSEVEFMNGLAAMSVNDQAAAEFFCELLDIDPADLNRVDANGKKVISTRQERQLQALGAAFKSGPGSQYQTSNGTAYGLLNAVTYYVDHQATVRDTTNDGKAQAKVASSMFGNGAAVKARAVQLLKGRVLVAA